MKKQSNTSVVGPVAFKRQGWLRIVSAVGVVLASSVAMAQYRVNSDGRQLDANNRLGSSGYNSGGDRALDVRQGGATGNQIVTGNVTGFKYFRGRVGYTDPGEFRGRTASQSTDDFIRDSAGTGDFIRGNTRSGSNPQAYYGNRYVAPAPEGFSNNAIGSGAYLPGPTARRQGADLRLGQVYDSPTITPIRPGDLLLPGPVDSSNNRTLLSASPLYGVRQWQAGGDDPYFLSRLNNVPRANILDNPRADDAAIMRMRAELRNTLVPEGAPTEGGIQDALPGTRIDAPIESPDASPLSSNALGSQIQTNAIGANLSTDATQRQRLIAPAQQSAQYAELEKRFRSAQGATGMTDEQAARQFQEQSRAKQQTDQAAVTKGGTGTTGAELGTVAIAPVAKPTAEELGLTDFAKQARERAEQAKLPGGLKPEPLQVKSLASGIAARGLGEVMTEAESLLKQGKYAAALDQYDLAEQVAPENPLIQLGRSNAELGAGFYARAEQHLREAFEKDPALLVGQYDLNAMLGEERVSFLVNDLKDIATAEPTQVRPAFLLAYLSYNTANERRAAAYLDLAEKRAGGRDPVLALLRQYWALPTDAPTTAPAETTK